MASRSGFKVEGLSQVIRALRALGLDATDLKNAFSKIAAEGATVVAGFAPKRSGRLAGTVRGNRAASKAVVTVGRATVPYAGPINYGWPSRGIAAQPFMQKADEHMRPVAIDRLETEINEAIRKRGLS